MGRIAKDGLEYFPVDVDIFEDDKILMAQEIVDPDGKEMFLRYSVPYIAIRMLREIFKKGYFIEWDDKVCRLQAGKIKDGITMNNLSIIVNSLIIVGFFNQDKFEEHNILTSHGIQKRWRHVMNLCRRKVLPIKDEFNLIKTDVNKTKSAKILKENIIVAGMPISSEVIPITSEDIRITSVKTPNLSGLSFSSLNNTITDNEGVITREDYESNIKNYFKEKEKKEKNEEGKPIPATRNGITSEDIGIPATRNGITSEDIGIPATETVFLESPKQSITLSKIDYQILSGTGEDFKAAWLEWVNYLFDHHRKEYKTLSSKRAAVEELVRISGHDEARAIKILNKTMSATWKNFFPLTAEDEKKSTMADLQKNIQNLNSRIAAETDPVKLKKLQDEKWAMPKQPGT